MQYNQFFKSDDFLSLIDELSQKYNVEDSVAQECIIKSLSDAYGYERLIINEDGSILGLNSKNKTSSFDLKHHNISKDVYKQFQINLSNEFYSQSFLNIENRFKELIKNSQSIFYGKVHDCNEQEITFKLFDSNTKELKNFYAIVKNDKKFLFSKERVNDFYEQSEKGMLLYIPQREKIVQSNGIFYIKAVRKHEKIIRYKINTVFKKLRDAVGISYGYKRCFIDTKQNKITLFLGLFFSPAAQEFFEKELCELEDFNLIYINDFKGQQ